MNNDIEYVDSLPGTGKTHSYLDNMKSRPDEKFIYLSPLLDEVETRIQDHIPEGNFKSPEGKNKTDDVLKLLEDGENIACTHALFERFDERHWRAIEDQGYELVCDEEVSAIKRYKCKNRDVEHLVEYGEVEVLEPCGKISLLKPLSHFVGGSFEAIAREAAKGTLYRSKCKAGQIGYLVTQLPIDLFLAPKKTTILTYNFKGSMLDKFLELHSISAQQKFIPLRKSNEEVIANLRSLINFKSTRAIEALSKYSLNWNWYNGARQDQLGQVGRAIRSVRELLKNDDSRMIVTLPKDNAGRGSRCVIRDRDRPILHLDKNGNPRPNKIDCFLAAKTRATNKYADRDVVVHLYDRNPNMDVERYFNSYGMTLDRDQFALSEMIQFIFRSAVRNGKPMDLYIASTRMKQLFENWLHQQEEEILDYAI
ncbi:hypothetical protein [Paracoccus tibetensis]|uniref:Quinolinate synthetase n=1 Tax=Paracoccus tibetensis TaxID=336292 RepID=A0A1G5F7B0_9RHOB|nr:hypothetical protein [Paracoccus tibetensis]SCY34991.1 quinolinate synthetase [Paracoccus tibetensis]